MDLRKEALDRRHGIGARKSFSPRQSLLAKKRIMITNSLRLSLVLAIGVVTIARAQETTKTVPGSAAVVSRWDMGALAKAPRAYPADAPSAKDVTSVFYEGLPWRKKPTRVFAYYGLPKVAPGTKVPGMVLVHGGGGSAFDAW